MGDTINIAIFASGSGSNAQNIWEFCEKNERLKVVCLVCDRPRAFVLKRAQGKDFPKYVIPKTKDLERSSHEDKILNALSNHEVHFILLAGYMRLFGPGFVRTFLDEQGRSRIVNIHPSLLPKYPGLNSYERCFENNDSYGGVSLHYVDEGMDTGEVIVQRKFPRLENDSLESFKERGLALEHEIYATFLKDISSKSMDTIYGTKK